MKGELAEALCESFLEALPLEFTIIDADDVIVAWNQHDSRYFKRPEPVLGRDVMDCHPPKSKDNVRKLLDDIKAGRKDKARFWIDFDAPNGKRKLLIEYFALRDKDGSYLGCAETAMDVTDHQDLQGEKRDY